MAKFTISNIGGSAEPEDDRPSGQHQRPFPRYPILPTFVLFVFFLLFVYGAYVWLVKRVVVGPGEVMVLLRKDASHSLSGDQIIIPRPPDAKDAAAYAQWDKQFGDCNGILEQVYPEGTYFGFSPFDYERTIVKAVVVDAKKVGVVVKKFGKDLDDGQVLADPARDQRGPLPIVLRPGRYNEYSNPLAYEVKQVDPIQVDPGHRGVVTILAGARAKNPNQYLVDDGFQGMQKLTEPEGFRYINPFEKRIIPISIQSQRFEMAGNDVIRFPSSDSFEIKMEGFVEWSIIPEKLPLIYVQYAEGGELIKYLDDKVILPYARSFCRLVGSQYNARDFISGDTKLKFQHEFESKLREACEKQGIEILQALVRDIVPPDDIKNPINEREIAKQQILSLQQQIQVAKSQADLARQTEMATQNQKIGEANKQVVTIVKKAEQDRDVALTKAKQDLAVAQLRLEASQKQADAQVARGQADANVILLNKQAEAEPLRQQIAAFGSGDAYAQYFFYQKVAPAVKSILTNTDGPFADLFRQFIQTSGQKPPEPSARK
ncbi:MAG TPA: SPFH domain-containing protein [Tepidisphaeraceae bacterium]|jgi:regulator of protease activity HflC (stomatin/prohibitin superfamily)